MKTLTLSFASLILVVGTAAAQVEPAGGPAKAAPAAPRIDATTPGECTKSLNDWRAAQIAPALAAYRQATPDNRAAAAAKYSAAYTALSTETVRAARECAARFDVATIAPEQLIDLVNLYAFVSDTANRRRATERVLTAKNLPPRQHAQALVLAMNQEVAASGSYFGIIQGAERIIAQIDALPDSLGDIKLAAHSSMMGRYEYLDVDDGIHNHAAAVIALARRLGKPDAMTSAYLSLARAAADVLHPDSALRILDNAEKELGAERVGTRFADFRNRYALIGTKAAPITGRWWHNVAGTPAPIVPGDGKVRLVEFTAHWCMPCKNSYPGLRALAERFRGKDFEGVLVTSLYGYLGDQRNLTPEQEVEADRIYFTQEHELPFKLAINSLSRDGRGSAAPPTVDANYRVGGIPQIVIIDRQGIIRQIVTGWDHGNTERIGNLIEQLLK